MLITFSSLFEYVTENLGCLFSVLNFYVKFYLDLSLEAIELRRVLCVEVPLAARPLIPTRNMTPAEDPPGVHERV